MRWVEAEADSLIPFSDIKTSCCGEHMQEGEVVLEVPARERYTYEYLHKACLQTVMVTAPLDQDEVSLEMIRIKSVHEKG